MVQYPCWVDLKRHPLNKSIRETYEYREWRTAIFIRDDYTCCLCRKRGGVLNADHYPKTYISVIRENEIDSIKKAKCCTVLWDTANGRTLCLECHRKTETWGYKAR